MHALCALLLVFSRLRLTLSVALALHAFMRGVITLEHEPYTIALEKLTVLNRELGHFTQAASLAAKAREFSNSFLFSS